MSNISSSFELLHETVKKWVWNQGWTSLRDIQENSIPVVLSGNSDVIISASTAGGKTEAAFLPILSRLVSEPSQSYDVLYVSPLKALINDQYRRLLDMTSETSVAVTPWHGDIDTSRKTKSLKHPSGILIITPESLESFLINRNTSVKNAFGHLKYVVIDELHAFIGNERGKQLQSLLSRIELITGNKAPRIAMSATFSNYDKVKEFLRSDLAFPCVIPEQGSSNHETRVLVKEYIPSGERDIEKEIANEVFTKLRGSNNLVFTNSRVAAEGYAVRLGDMSDEGNVPNEFRVHHGSLSKVERESVEQELQAGGTPITALCTSTLELGVDIGKVKSISQIGVANSVSGLRQRLGRSGRRNEPSILRVFSVENDESAGVLYELRTNLVQNIAVIELLREKAYEDPVIGKPHLSTLIQQILSLVASFSGFYPKEGWEILCKHGAFKNISPELFLALLKCMGQQNLISQLNTGEIIIGKEGERLLRRLDFYTAFVAPVDYDVINNEDFKRVGMIQSMPEVKSQLILAGRRWIVNRVDEKSRKIYVSRIKTGGAISFASEVPEVDELITKKMRDIYTSAEVYPYLDTTSESDKELLKAREYFTKNELNMKCYVNNSLFTWAGAKVNRTIALICKLRLRKDLDYDYLRIYGITPKDIKYVLSQPKPKGDDLAALVSRDQKEKQQYDHFLSDELLNHEYACTYLDVEKAWKELQKLSTLTCEDLPEMPIDPDSYDDDDEEAYEEYEAATGYEDFDGIYDYRHIRDISNVIKYDTLAEPLNKVIHQYIIDANFDCEVLRGVIFENAPEHAMPINFLLRRDDKEVAVLLVHRSKVKRYSLQETEALCQEHGVNVRRFYFECDNEKEYVIERIRKALE
jgi:ATP-dependent Lhr-like helicase